MRIIYTKHAKKKFKDLAELGIKVTRSLIRKTINNPTHLDGESDYPKKIASRELDKEHALRVVFKEEDDIIVVITFYPARKGRYF